MGATAASGPSFISGIHLASASGVKTGALGGALATAMPAANETAARPAIAPPCTMVFLVMDALLCVRGLKCGAQCKPGIGRLAMGRPAGSAGHVSGRCQRALSAGHDAALELAHQL